MLHLSRSQSLPFTIFTVTVMHHVYPPTTTQEKRLHTHFFFISLGTTIYTQEKLEATVLQNLRKKQGALYSLGENGEYKNHFILGVSLQEVRLH